MTMGLTNLVNDVVIIIVSLTFMLYKSWGLTLLSLIASPIIGLAMGRYGAQVQKFTARTQNRLSEAVRARWPTMAHEGGEVLHPRRPRGGAVCQDQ